MLSQFRVEQKSLCQDSTNKRFLSNLKLSSSEQRYNNQEKTRATKEGNKKGSKKSRRRRRPANADESNSTSQDKNSTIVNSKQIKVSKDKYSLSSHMSKLVRKSINEHSSGQDKTVKMPWRASKDKTVSQEEKKKNLDAFNETIRRNNQKALTLSKDHKNESFPSHSFQEGQMNHTFGNVIKKMNKVLKNKKNTDTANSGQAVIEKHHERVPTAKNLSPTEQERKKRNQTVQSIPLSSKQNELGDVKKQGDKSAYGKRATSAIEGIGQGGSSGVQPLVNLNANNAYLENKEKIRHKDKSPEERRSTDEAKRKIKTKGKKDIKKNKQLSKEEAEKIKENLAKLNFQAKLALKNTLPSKALSKRLTKQRRSKSSNDLFGEHILRKVAGRSDSVNSRSGKEDTLYQEYRNLIIKEKKSIGHRDPSFKDRILRKTLKDRTTQPPIKLIQRQTKMKISKSSKIQKRTDSIPEKSRKYSNLPVVPIPLTIVKSPSNQMPSSTRAKDPDRDIHDRISQLSSTLQKNYESIPRYLMNTKPGVSDQTEYKSQTQANSLQQPPHKKKGKRSKKTINSKKRENGNAIDNEEIAEEEREIIEKEILQVKNSGSEYNSGEQKRKEVITISSSYRMHAEIKSSIRDKKAEVELNDHVSPSSVKIRDSDSSYADETSPNDREMLNNRTSSRNDINNNKWNLPSDPLSQENFEKWLYLLQEFKKCESNGYVDEELKELLKTFCDKTQKGITQLLQTGSLNTSTGKKLTSENKQKDHGEVLFEEDAPKRRRPKLGIDVDGINEDFKAQAYTTESQMKENRSSSFQWLRAEFEQNLEELSKLLGKDSGDMLKKIQDAMELNERYSDMFELRVSAIEQRYQAQKNQVNEIMSDKDGSQAKKELLDQLHNWYKEEMTLMDSEKKKITKGWFTSIDAIRKIKRDLEIAKDSKTTFGKKSSLKGGHNGPEEMTHIYNVITKTLASPKNRRKELERRLGKDFISPMGSPNAGSAYSQSKIISDPNLRSMKLKQGDKMKRNEVAVKSLEGYDLQKSGTQSSSIENLGRGLEISEAKQNIINEIQQGLDESGQKKSIGGVEIIKNDRLKLNDDSPFASPLNPSIDSSNFYNVSPTSVKKYSKPGSSNKPRSTIKSDSVDEKGKADDFIWIKDQGKSKIDSSQSVETNQLLQNHSLPPVIKDSTSVENKSNNLVSNSQPLGLQAHNVSKGLSESQLQESLPLVGIRVIEKPTEKTKDGLNSTGAIYGLESIKKEMDKIPRQTDDQGSEPRDASSKEATKKSLFGKTQQFEQEDYINDLIQGIGFDSQVIKNEFEDSKKSQYALDDFASMSDSDREHDKRRGLISRATDIADEVLDAIFTNTIADMFQILENENANIEMEIQSGYNQQIFLQDGQFPFNPPGIQSPRKGIRVNFNAVKEYLSLLINFVKESRTDILTRLNTPYGLSVNEKLGVFHEGFDETSGCLTTNRATQRLIVSYDIYMKLEDEIAVSKENEDQFRQGMEHIHNKMLFDSFNEALDSLRPFGLKGCPFNWRPNAGRILPQQYQIDKLPEALEKAQERVLDWTMFMCGFIPNKDDSMLGDIAIEEDYLNQIKEDRLIKMLTCEAFETDERWLIYDDEEVEVQTEVAELIFDQLLEEAVNSLNIIKKKSFRNPS